MSITLSSIISFRQEERDEIITSASVDFDVQCRINEPSVIDNFNIFWIQTGQSRVQIDFQSFDVTENTLFFLSPGQMFTVMSDQIVQGFQIAFNQAFFCIETHHRDVGCSGVLFNNPMQDPLLQLDERQSEELQLLYADLQRSILSESVAKDELVKAYLKIFIIKCVELKLTQLPSHLSIESRDDVTEFNRLLEKNYKRWHRVDSYARAMHITSKALNKRLSKFGKPPSQMIRERLMLAAKRLLVHSDLSVKEIAFELGFEDPHYFSRLFKKSSKKTPLEFRTSFSS